MNTTSPENAHSDDVTNQIDLTTCDREPIHILGFVQPFGVLLVLSDDFKIAQISDNAGEIFGRESGELLGRHLGVLLHETSIGNLRRALENEAPDDRPFHIGQVSLRTDGARNELSDANFFRAIVHRRHGICILELESLARTVRLQSDSYAQLGAAVSRIQAAQNLEDLCQQAAREVRHVTGFDKVMIYRFDADWNGLVIAEDKVPDIESFLGFRFPASDIPAQARTLYVQNRVRIIADVADARSQIVPTLNPQTGAPLDLSFAGLRSVSPVHIEYLKNMGVTASMSISIVKDGVLWGLVACHHREARPLGFETRAACEFLGQVLALQISSGENLAIYEAQLRAKTLVASLLDSMANNDYFVKGLTKAHDELLELTNSCGATLLFDGTIASVGKTPADAEILELVQWLESQRSLLEENGDNTLWHTDSLPIEYSISRDWSAPFAGLLAISVSQVHRSYVLWFREEAVQNVVWGGNPTKPVSVENDESIPLNERRLHPRRSFEMWNQEIGDKSTPWLSHEIEAAGELRRAIARIVLKNAEEMAQLTQELERSNQELESFSYSISHDLRAPFRHITGFASLLRKRVESDLDATSLRYLDTISNAAQNAGTLVDNLLNFSRMARSEMTDSTVDLNEIVEVARHDLVLEYQNRDVEWRISEMPIVRGDRDLLLQVMKNLLGNAVKYSARREKAIIEIGCLSDKNAAQANVKPSEVAFFVRDNGVGFNMQYVDKIFGVFQRLHRAEEFEGTGIGLANVQRIIARHGGRVWAHGEPNVGATLFFTLPRNAPASNTNQNSNLPNDTASA